MDSSYLLLRPGTRSRLSRPLIPMFTDLRDLAVVNQHDQSWELIAFQIKSCVYSYKYSTWQVPEISLPAKFRRPNLGMAELQRAWTQEERARRPR